METYAVGDRALVDAIDLLSRRTAATGREFVDYRTLGVRHLGSIYEGLLEYQPRYATEPTVAVRDGKGERWAAEAELKRPFRPNWISRMTDQMATCFQVNCIPPIRVPIDEATDQTNGHTISRLEVRRKMAA
jgi:hypothetical protein